MRGRMTRVKRPGRRTALPPAPAPQRSQPNLCSRRLRWSATDGDGVRAERPMPATPKHNFSDRLPMKKAATVATAAPRFSGARPDCAPRGSSEAPSAKLKSPPGGGPFENSPSSHSDVRFSGANAAAAASIAAAMTWAYWPVLLGLERTWSEQADYSHGYLVAPLAILFLWVRRDRLPRASSRLDWRGLALLSLALCMRLAGALWYLPALESWSLPICLAGVAWFLGGRDIARWSLPAIAFLAFMLPLPYRAERILSLPLQFVATRASCWVLECFGEPAICEGNVIVMRDARLLVAEACSGIRIFISVLALAFAYTALLNRRWWCKACLLASVLPVAVLVNVLRITITGLLHAYVANETAQHFAHEVSGWAMLPAAAILLALAPWYASRLVVEAETVNPPDLLSKALATTSTLR